MFYSIERHEHDDRNHKLEHSFTLEWTKKTKNLKHTLKLDMDRETKSMIWMALYGFFDR